MSDIRQHAHERIDRPALVALLETMVLLTETGEEVQVVAARNRQDACR